jgi:hypothetical protein
MYLKQKNMEREFPFFERVDFSETKRRGSLYITHKPPRQKFFKFSPPLQWRGIFLHFYFSLLVKRFLIVLTNSFETPK